MELWIRSQDKESLTKVSNIQYTYIEGNLYTDVRGKHFIGTNYDEFQILGKYKTKERALEVLNDIEDKLINCTFAQKQNGLGEVLDFMPNSIYVYTMPEE